MEKIFIVHAHPESKSFCSSLKNTAVKYFFENGAEVKVSDLYEMNFPPVLFKEDFTSLKEEDYFKPQLEQLNAFQNNLFNEKIMSEMVKLDWCDTMIFNFPLWWFSMPAILKGWVDRVFAMGYIYGGGKGIYEHGVFRDKKAFLTLTTGGPNIAYGSSGKNGKLEEILFPINHGMLYFIGAQVLESFISFGPARMTNEERSNEIERYKNYLKNLDKQSPIY